MQKFLRTLMLAALLLPFASNAQNTLTVADGTATNSYVPVYGLYVDDFVRCQTIYPASEIEGAAGSYLMTNGTITGLTYYLSTSAAASWGDAIFVVNIKEVTATTLTAFVDMTDATTVYTGSLDATGSTMTITFTTPYTYQGGNLLIEIYNTLEGTYKSASFYGIAATGASWQGNSGTSVAAITGATRAFIPKTTFTFTGGTQVTCAPVENLAASNITSTNATLTWSGNASGYTLYEYANTDSADYMYTDTFAVLNTLQPNTEYTFGVVSDCGADGESVMRTVTFRTACAAISLPFTEGFEAVPAGSYQMPFCWSRYTSAYTTTAIYPYSYNSNAHDGSRALYFYGATTSAYPDTMVAILPELDVTTYPMNGNRLIFWAKMGAATNSKNVYVGTMTDPTDPSTFVLVDSVLVSGNTYTRFPVSLTNASATAPYLALAVMKGTGTMYIDDLTLEEMPSCLEVPSVEVTGVTTTSVSLSWTANDGNASATYSVYDMSDTSLVASGITATTYTVENLNSSTAYTFGIQANCPAGDAPYTCVSANTACDAVDLPYTETFAATSGTRNCWDFISMNTGNDLGTSNGMGFVTVNNREVWRFSSYSNHGGSNDYNQYGYSPVLNVSSSATNLQVDVTFATYNSANKLWFGYITPTDTIWDTTAYTTTGSSDFQTETFILPATVTQLAVHYYGSYSYYAWIDSVVVTEMTGEYCYPVTGLAASAITAEGAILSWNGTAAGSYTVVNMADGSVVTSGADTTYTLTGLTAMTQYSYGVVANCTSSNSDTVVVTFNTACTALTLPYTEGFELTSNAIGCWSVEGTGNWTVGTGDYNTTTGAFEGTYNAKITHGTTGNVTKLVSPALDGVENGLLLDFAYVMRAWSSDIDELRVYSRASDTAAWQMIAEYTDAAATWTVANVIIPGTVYQVAFEYTDNYGYGLGIDSVVFTPMSGSFCYPVADLAVDSVTATSVFLSWSDENNTGATYSIYGNEGNVIATNVAGTSYEVTNLIALTGYTFGVAANCSAEESSDVATIGAVTGCASTTCEINVYAEDAWGDGWNGAILEAKQNGFIVANYTMASQSQSSTRIYDTASITVCASAPVELQWFSGQYDYEIAFTIADYNGDSLYAVDSASNLIDGATFFNLTAPCGAAGDDSLTVILMVNDSTLGSITPAVGVYRLALGDSITLTATPYGDNVFNGWLTYIDGEVLATLPINPFTFPASVNNVNHTMLLIAQFAAAGAAPDSVTIIINVDNPLMGTTSPAPGTYRVAVGDPLDMVALPNAGFHNLYWIESATFMGTTFTDTLAYDTLNFFASPMMANATLNYTAYFEANPPVESTIDASEITYWVGTGSNQAVVAVNWSNGAYAWGVRFNGESITVQDALDSMAAYDYRFDYSADGYLNNITFDEGNLHLTGLLGSFWESKHNGISDMGLAQTLVNGDFEKWAEPAAGVITDSIYYGEEWGWYYIYTYTMSILPMWAPEPESISITFNVNDPTLGSIDPSGVRIFEVGDELTVTATPAEGCSFVSWTVTTAQGETMTLQRDMTSFTDTVEAIWNGSTLTANFVRNQGIDEVESADFQAYSLNGKVIVKGVENMDVNVYDVTGRSVNNVAKAAETVEFTVPAAGVYMVKVGNAVKRVVVIR